MTKTTKAGETIKIYTLEFKLPGWVTINYSKFSDEAEAEMDKIEERLKSNYSADYFFVQGTN